MPDTVFVKVKDAAGRRSIATETLWLQQNADICRDAYPDRGKKLPKGELPNFIVRIAAIFDNRIKAVVSDLGTLHEIDNQYVTDLTCVNFRAANKVYWIAAPI